MTPEELDKSEREAYSHPLHIESSPRIVALIAEIRRLQDAYRAESKEHHDLQDQFSLNVKTLLHRDEQLSKQREVIAKYSAVLRIYAGQSSLEEIRDMDMRIVDAMNSAEWQTMRSIRFIAQEALAQCSAMEEAHE